MSISTTYNYSSGSGFLYNPAFVTFMGGMAELLPANVPGETFLPSISAATYNSSWLQYLSSTLEQLDQRPSTATFYAAWTSQLNGNWSGSGNGSLVVTASGTAAIDSGGLDLTGSGSSTYVTIPTANNLDTTGTGTIIFQYTPNYSGSPSSTQNILSASAAQSSVLNLINIFHTNNGNLSLQIHNSGGASPVNIGSAWSPVSGTTYTIMVQYTSGASTLFLNGTSFITSNATYTRTGISYAVIGEQFSGAGTPPNFWIKNFAWYSTVVTPASAVLNPTIYNAATGTMPLFTYSGVGNLQAFTGFSTTDFGGIAYTVNGKYWNGSAWVTSNGTYAQANSASVINTNIAALTVVNTMEIVALYNAGTTQQGVSLITLTYTGQLYPLAGATIAPNLPLTMDALYTFSDVHTLPTNTHLGWVIEINGTFYWYNGSAWVVSNLTEAESNFASVVQTNASTLPIALGAYVVPYVILYTSDGLSTPTLTSLTLSYDYFGPTPTPPNQCEVYGYITDDSGNPVVDAVVTVLNPATFINNTVVVAQGIQTITTDSIGYFHISLIETASLTPNPPFYTFSVVYPTDVSEGVNNNKFLFGNAVIPNVASANITSLTFTPALPV